MDNIMTCTIKQCKNDPKFAFKYIEPSNHPIKRITLNLFCLKHMREFKGTLGESAIYPAQWVKEGFQPYDNNLPVGPVFDTMFNAADFWNSILEIRNA